MPIQTLNPATGKVEKTFEELSKEKIKKVIDNADRAFLSWRTVSFEQRKKSMLNAANVLRSGKKKYGEILTLEMGKLLREAESEVEKCAWVCEHYAENAELMLRDESVETDASESYIRFDPIGVVLAVMPWNFPFWQVFRFAAPALMAGNVGLLKHASNVPQCALAIEEIFIEAGFPEHTFNTLLIGSSAVNDVIYNPVVKAATLTGSEFAGKQVAEACGRKLKKSVMELGGSDPFIILADTDVDEAVNTAVIARLINNGQSCIAAKRFIAVKDIADEFTDKFVDKMSNIKVGDPLDESSQLGPIAREDLRKELHVQVTKSAEMGASVLTGGKMIDGDGYYYPATVLGNVTPGMPAYDDEIFGPVASVIAAEDEEDAVRIANDSEFGLGSALWTNDLEKAKKLAGQIESGCVFINGMVKSDPRLPFGGVKLSGYGRELSQYGIKEFVNIKSVWIK